jgi:hypothetical protein
MNRTGHSISLSRGKPMAAEKPGKLALLWRKDTGAWRGATAQNNRLNRVFEELAALGIATEAAIYSDDRADDVRAQLLGCDGVLVWVDPLSEGHDRIALDALLRDVAAQGVWVSAHPDVILKMGVKEVLYRTKDLGWGSDTHLYRTAQAFHDEFPRRLRSAGPRVLKQNRGNGGQGIWKVELMSAPAKEPAMVRALQAPRGSVPEDLPLGDFMRQCESYFAGEGCIIDQPFEPRLPDGMIRCYMGADKVVGFGHQLIKALIPPPPESAPAFQVLRTQMESAWTPQMMQLLGIDADALPIIWDADFLHGPRDAQGNDTYVLCEINVSSVFPFPDQAPAVIARLALDRINTHKAARR